MPTRTLSSKGKMRTKSQDNTNEKIHIKPIRFIFICNINSRSEVNTFMAAASTIKKDYEKFFPQHRTEVHLRECPAYTLLCQFSPKDTGQSKVKQSHKIDEITTVASAQAPKSLQPGKCPFHYPAAGWIPPAFTHFFPPAADMLLKSVNIDFLADSWIIIPLVQTEVSNFSPQKPAAHFPRVFQGCSYQAAVMDIGACDRHSQRNTLTVHMEMNLAATSPSVRRVAAKPLSRCFFESASALAARCRP